MGKWYEEMGIEDICISIQNEISATCASFVAIGYYLKQVRDRELYLQTGYEDIWEFAQKQFGISKSSASRFMNINDRFSIGGNSPELLEQYEKFSSSQLSEMLTLTDGQIEQVTVETTVKEIRAMKPKKEKKCDVKASGGTCSGCFHYENVGCPFPKEKELLKCRNNPDYVCGIVTVMEEHFLVKGNIEGCTGCCQCCLKREKCEYVCDYVKDNEDGEDNPEEENSVATSQQEAQIESVSSFGCTNSECCFCCAQDCKIRQEERYCVEAPLGNPFSCTTMNVLENLKDEFGGECQFINQELAEKRCGDGESVPCCKKCNVYDCGYRCKRAVNLRIKQNEEATPVQLESGEDKVIADDPERYTEYDVKEYLKHEEENLMICRQEGVQSKIRKHTALNVDAYSMLLGVMQENDEVLRCSHTADKFYLQGDYESADFYLYQARKTLYETKEYDRGPVKPEVNETLLKQPELPILRNNEKRGAFIDGFEEWPVWIECQETGERYWRYEIDKDIAIVVKGHQRHLWISGKGKRSTTETEYAGYEYYLLGVEIKYGRKGYEFKRNPNKTFFESLTNRSGLIDFLKQYQKGELTGCQKKNP